MTTSGTPPARRSTTPGPWASRSGTPIPRSTRTAPPCRRAIARCGSPDPSSPSPSRRCSRCPGCTSTRRPRAFGRGPTEPNPWRLGHVSGRGLAALPSREDALRGAREIGDMTDWTRTPEEIRADSSFDKEEYVDRITSRTNGLLFPSHRKGAELCPSSTTPSPPPMTCGAASSSTSPPSRPRSPCGCGTCPPTGRCASSASPVPRPRTPPLPDRAPGGDRSRPMNRPVADAATCYP